MGQHCQRLPHCFWRQVYHAASAIIITHLFSSRRHFSLRRCGSKWEKGSAGGGKGVGGSGRQAVGSRRQEGKGAWGWDTVCPTPLRIATQLRGPATPAIERLLLPPCPTASQPAFLSCHECCHCHKHALEWWQAVVGGRRGKQQSGVGW